MDKSVANFIDREHKSHIAEKERFQRILEFQSDLFERLEVNNVYLFRTMDEVVDLIDKSQKMKLDKSLDTQAFAEFKKVVDKLGNDLGVLNTNTGNMFLFISKDENKALDQLIKSIKSGDLKHMNVFNFVTEQIKGNKIKGDLNVNMKSLYIDNRYPDLKEGFKALSKTLTETYKNQLGYEKTFDVTNQKDITKSRTI